MKLKTVKRYRKKHKFLNALIMRNPVLVMGLDLPFVIAAATSLRNAAAMAVQIFIIHVATMAVGIVTRRKLPFWLRTMANVAVATVMMMLARQVVTVLFRGISNSLGMYLYLMAVNSMSFFQAAYLEKRAKLLPVLSSAASNAAAFSVVAFATAFIREYLGNGTLWGISVPAPLKMSGLLIPFGGFIIVGFLLALTRFLNKSFLAISLSEAARKEANRTRIHIESVEEIDI